MKPGLEQAVRAEVKRGLSQMAAITLTATSAIELHVPRHGLG